MRQILQDLRTGRTRVEEVPAPHPVPGALLVRTRRSLISAGTERMLVEFSRANLLQKARAQPDKVRQVLDKIRADGLIPTLEAVFRRLDEPLPLGYCNAGVVVEAGDDPRTRARFQPGDRVVSNGPHAELVSVPRNLCATIPDGVSDDEAAFAVLASIGLQGIRLAAPTLGERVVVVGLGLIGLVTVQLLRAAGCRVLGVEPNPARLRLAETFGAETVRAGAEADPVIAANAWTEGRGVDAVLITASARTNEIVHQAAQMCRKRGRIVLVGVVGLDLRRSDFYEKELSFQVSCSYGPGRYDAAYEQGGQDYPYGFVRWTEQRNFEAVLDMMAAGRLDVTPLISHRFPLAAAADAYAAVQSDPAALGVLLEYAHESRPREHQGIQAPDLPAPKRDGGAIVGVIGAGNFAKMTLMPALSKTDAQIAYLCDLDGVSAGHLARKYGAGAAVSDYRQILDDDRVDAVFIAVGHQAHARLVCEALAAGKHALVEKPLAMNPDELRTVIAAAGAAGNRHLMVGFNRRFSRHVTKMTRLLAGRSEPLAMTFTANAGAVPADHWVHDPVQGGGRIVGEACHYIDLMVHLAGRRVRTVAAAMMGGGVAVHEDKMAISLGFEDGSVGAINYFANGPRAYPKERMEVFSEGRALRLDNFRVLRGYGFRGFRAFRTWRQDKGHRSEFAAFVRRVTEGGRPLIPLDQLVNVTLASFAAMTAARERRTVDPAEEYVDVLGAPPPQA
ncbi:MAG: bi-domain-containing oxidoreductase [Planctomycetota bacterium]